MNGLGVAIATKIDTLVQCICAALEADGAGETCFCGVWPGEQVSWDYCGECSNDQCGMGYVNVVQSFQSSTFPQQQNPTAGCSGAPLVLELSVGALRCAPLPDEQGVLPNELAQAETWLGQVADMTALFTAICECLPDAAIGSYTSLGPQGGCVGGEWTVWVSL